MLTYKRGLLSINSQFSRRILILLAGLLVLQTLGSIPQPLVPKANATALGDCAPGQFTVTAKHNSVFYFDAGTTITSGYAQYEIVNNMDSDTVVVRMETFTGGALSLARFETSTRTIDFSSSSTSNQYWYLTASAVSSSAQNHNLVFYDSTTVNAICKLNLGFTRTASTIAASANKVTSVTYSALPAPDATGANTFTATVKGQTGTIGAGPTGNSDVNLNPATHADFAAGNFRLSGTSYQCSTSTVTGTLYIPNACAGNYTAVFTYQYISSSFDTGALKSISPIMQIASGTQMKHTSTPSFTVAAIQTDTTPRVTTVGATLMTSGSVTLNGSRDVGTFTKFYFCISTVSPADGRFDTPTETTECTYVYETTTTSGTEFFYETNVASLAGPNKYYYEFIGESGGNLYYGGVKTFGFLVTDEFIDTTTAASSITGTTATLNGIQSGLDSVTVSSAFFIYTTDSPTGTTSPLDRVRRLDPYSNDTVTATISGVDKETYTANISGLAYSTTYYFELVVLDTNTAQYFGGIRSFTTDAASEITVTFDPDGGTLPGGVASYSAVIVSGENALLSRPDPDPTRYLYVFAGWNTLRGTGTGLSSYSATTSVTLYAQWLYVGPVPASITWPTPASIQYPAPLTATQLNAVAICRGVPVTSGTYTYNPALGTVLPVGTHTLNVTWTPADSGCLAVSTSVQIIVTAANAPTITWPTPTPVAGPATLSPTQLNATCSVPGTLVYSPALGTVLQPGTYTLTVTCIPTDPNIPSVSTTVQLVVNRMLPTITWVNPSPMAGPATLTNTQLNAACSVPGTLTYTPALGAVLEPGTYTLSVTCTPTDPNYGPVSTTVSLVVNRLNPTITWPTPTPVAGPLTLSPTQLNATCSVPGTLVYDPALGAVLQPGTYVLRVTCNPTDATRYAPVTTTVTLTVLATRTLAEDRIPGAVTTEVPARAELNSASTQVTSLCTGIGTATIRDGRLSYTPLPTFSGRSCVTVTTTIGNVSTLVTVPVIVIPVAPVGVSSPVTFRTGVISWQASPNANSYTVAVRGVQVCETTQTTCSVNNTLGPKTPVTITALGNDGTSTDATPKYSIEKPLPALVVNFDTAKFNLKPADKKRATAVAKIIKREGFTRMVITGHTDSQGGVDNNKLSLQRAKSLETFIKSKLPAGTKFKVTYSAFRDPVASNQTESGKASNRRADLAVW